jgi:phage gp36-like protein
MGYATIQDLQDRYLERDLIQLSDPLAQTLQTAVLQKALDDADSEIDSYLVSRYALPFANPPAVLVRVACELAIFHLQTLRSLGDLEDSRARYRHDLEFLRGVNAGHYLLGEGASAAPQATATSIAIRSQDRVLTNELLDGFRCQR